MNLTPWTIEVHQAFDFDKFLESLDSSAMATVALYLQRISQVPSLTDAPRAWIRPLGQGLFEFRIRDSRTLVRLFFTYKRGRLVLLLGGYDKRSDPSTKRQQTEIAIARRRLLDS